MKDGGRLMRRGRDGKWRYVEAPGEEWAGVIVGLIVLGGILYFVFNLFRNG
jgi:hypothetical protein